MPACDATEVVTAMEAPGLMVVGWPRWWQAAPRLCTMARCFSERTMMACWRSTVYTAMFVGQWERTTDRIMKRAAGKAWDPNSCSNLLAINARRYACHLPPNTLRGGD